MGDFQDTAAPGAGQALGGQLQHLIDAVLVNFADGLQAHLHDLFEAVGAFGNTVDIFIVIELADARLVPGVFHNGKGYVRLQSHELSAHIGEGNDGIGNEEILVFGIQVVFLKFVHLVSAVAVAAVKDAQGRGKSFGWQACHGRILLALRSSCGEEAERPCSIWMILYHAKVIKSILFQQRRKIPSSCPRFTADGLLLLYIWRNGNDFGWFPPVKTGLHPISHPLTQEKRLV